MRGKYIVPLILMVMLFETVSINGYEDVTHQKLTQRALQVAADNAGSQDVPSSLVQKFVFPDGRMNTMGFEAINGAGMGPEARGDKGHPVATDGEDYTRYRITHHHCNPWKVHRHVWWSEPLNHFRHGMLGGAHAEPMCYLFFNDAVKLWKHGKKADAAFILGRAA